MKIKRDPVMTTMTFSTDSESELRRFCAYCSTAEGYAAPMSLAAASHHEAAFDFADYWHGDGVIGVIVTDEMTGERACFTMDVGH